MKSGMTRLALGAATLLLAALALAEPVADLEGPIGGWRNSKLTNELEQYTAAYPKPPVDRGAQKYRTLIAGRIRAVGKQRRPPVLVVNGDQDTTCPPSAGRRLAAAVSGRFELVPRGGHVLPLELPELSTRFVADFVDSSVPGWQTVNTVSRVDRS